MPPWPSWRTWRLRRSRSTGPPSPLGKSSGSRALIKYLPVLASNPPYRARHVRRVKSSCTGGLRRRLFLRLHARRSGCRSRPGWKDELFRGSAASEGGLRLRQILLPSLSPLALTLVLADRHLRPFHLLVGLQGSCSLCASGAFPGVPVTILIVSPRGSRRGWSTTSP